MKNKITVVMAIAMIVLLAGCSTVSPRSLEIKAALESVLAKANDIGFTGGVPNKDCAVPFDCSANDLYSSTILLASPDLNDSVVCEELFALGEDLGFGEWRRDYHDVEETYDQKNLDDGLKACVESIAVNVGEGNPSQSEGVKVLGLVKTSGKPVWVMIQVSSINKPEWNKDAERGYYVQFETTES